ncbi:purine and uridine phosphorylase, partial [Aureobasidium melanogenum]
MGRYKALESGELYTVGWIAALPKEMTAALGMLDERHDKPKDFVKPASDTNAYRWGRIGDHNVVIASLAAGVYGTTSAATTAIQMLSSFPSIKVGLMVGIGAAIPGSKHDIRLGDVVVSQPHGQTGGVVQYDLGKSRVITEQGNPVKTFERVGFLRPPPEALLKALSLLKAEVRLEGSSLSHFLKDMLERHPRMAQSGPDGPGYFHQGNENDRLFEASYLHISDVGCNSCNPTRMIPRSSRSNPGEPEVHYGLIASGNKLVKDAAERDLISRESGGDCICLDMEAAGLINSFPCLVIRGICDYADSHKNDDWQEYAAGTAAAYAKEFLGYGGLVQMVEYLIDRGEESADTDATALPTDLKEGLKLASWRGYDTTVQLLLDRGTDVNAGDGAALRKASQLGYDTTVQLLLDRGADVDAGNGAALKIASWSGHSTTVQLLLDRHANVNAGDGAALGEASAHGYDTIVQLLLDRGADINAGDSAALIMASQGGSEKVVQFLLDRGADIHARDGAALMKASKYGREAVVRLLLDRGMDANLQDGAALRLALKRERHTVVQLLLDRGADVNAQDGFALHEAVRLGRDIIVRLLLDGGADVNVRGKYGQTALMEALQREHHTITQLLLDRDASLSPEELEYALLWDDQGAKSLVSIILPYITVRSATHKNNMGRNLLHHAVVRELESVVQKCLDLSVDIRVRDGYGMTALDWAAAQGHLTISKMLLRAGSDVEEPNEHGWTPLAYLADLASWERRARSWERGRKRSWESSSEYDSVWERSPEGSQERSWDYNQEIDWEAQYRKCREGRGRPRRRRSC